MKQEQEISIKRYIEVKEKKENKISLKYEEGELKGGEIIIDLISFFEKELNCRDISIEKLVEKAKFLPLKDSFKNKRYEESFIQDNKYVIYVKNLNSFLVNLEVNMSLYITKFEKNKELLEYYKEYHPNKFQVEVLISNIDIKDLDFFEVEKRKEILKIENIKEIKLENIDLKNIEVEEEEIKLNIIFLKKMELRKKFKSMYFLKKHLYLKNIEEEITELTLTDNLKEMTKKLKQEELRETIKKNIMEKVEKTILYEVSKYNEIHSFDYQFGKQMIKDNKEYFENKLVNSLIKIEKELEEYKLSDILEEDLKKDFKQKKYIEINIPELYIKESELHKEMIEYKSFIEKDKFIINNKYYHRSQKEKITNKESILKMNFQDFIDVTDGTTEKKMYNLILNDKYKELRERKIEDIILNDEKSIPGILKGSDFLNILNAYGGYWILFFDLLRIEKGKSQNIDLYEYYFNQKKRSYETFIKRQMLNINLLFEYFKFSEEEKKKIKEIVKNNIEKTIKESNQPHINNEEKKESFLKEIMKKTNDFDESLLKFEKYILKIRKILDKNEF